MPTRIGRAGLRRGWAALFLLCAAVAEGAEQWKLTQEYRRDTGSPALALISKTVVGERLLSLHLVLPDPTRTRLIVLDNPENGRRLDESMLWRGCVAGVNGGYFRGDARPIGLVVSEGRRLHGYQRAKLLSGVLAIRDGQPRLLRSAEYRPEEPLSDALQAGPFLIDGARPVTGLEATKQARRTVLVTDGGDGYALLVLDSPVTLAEAAAVLSSPGVVHELTAERALNLDGGSSTAFWVRTADSAFYLFEWKRARNFLCVLEDLAGG